MGTMKATESCVEGVRELRSSADAKLLQERVSVSGCTVAGIVRPFLSNVAIKHRLAAVMSVVSLCIAVSTSTPVEASPSFDVVVVSGDTAPDNDGTFDNVFSGDAVFNDAGQVGFRASLTGTPNDQGIFRRDGATGPIVQVARTGQAVPNGTGTFDTFSVPSMNDAGEMVFQSFVTGGPARSLLRFDGSSAQKVAQENDPAVGGGTVTFVSTLSPLISGSGQIAHQFGVTGSPGGNDGVSAILTDTGTNYGYVARPGEIAPGGTDAFDGGAGSISPVAVNDAGQVVIRSQVLGGDVTDAGRGLFLFDGTTGNGTKIARSGDASPDSDGDLLKFDGPIGLNNSGVAMFNALVTNTFSGNDENIVLTTPDGGTTFNVVARTGDASPDGVGDLGGIEGFGFNDAGQALVGVTFTNTPNPGTGAVSPPNFDTGDTRGLMYFDGSSLEVIARSGQASPDGLGELAVLTGSIANDLGQVAFTAFDRFTPGFDAGTFDDISSLQVYDPTLGTFLLARQGDAFLDSTFTSFTLAGINDTDLLIQFGLANGDTGLALYDLSQIPEPNTAVLLGLGCVGLMARRRRD